MPASVMYHDGNRQLQDRFASRRISDRLEEKLTRKAWWAQLAAIAARWNVAISTEEWGA